MKFFNNFNISRLTDGLSKTRDKFVNKITETFSGKASIDDETLNELEEILISSDISSELAEKIIINLKMTLKSEKDRSIKKILELLKAELLGILEDKERKLNPINQRIESKPFVILVVGVNGAGKTTTVGKLANNFKMAGNRVIVGSADTFRAAANEQLEIWAQRAGVELVQKEKGADPSAIAFDTVRMAVEGDYDIVIIDTAGRLHSKLNLMSELSKITRAINKVLPNAPNETYLVLDATLGQNALKQVEEFLKVAKINGLVLTKIDGTAKGGTVFSIYDKYKIPVKYIGVGEKINDLQSFDARSFVEAIFENKDL